MPALLAEQVQQVASSDTSRVAVVQADWTTGEAVTSAVDLRPLFTDGSHPDERTADSLSR